MMVPPADIITYRITYKNKQRLAHTHKETRPNRHIHSLSSLLRGELCSVNLLELAIKRVKE